MQEQFFEIKIKYFYETSHVLFPKKSCVRGWLKEEMFQRVKNENIDQKWVHNVMICTAIKCQETLYH